MEMKIHSNRRKDEREGTRISNEMIVLGGMLAGITMLFVALTVSYLFSSSSWQWKQFAFPKLFLLSAIVIVLSSFTLHQAVQYFDVNKRKKHVRCLGITSLLSCLFLICQGLGWMELYQSGIYVAGKPDGSYLYLISGLHALHVLVGVFLLLLVYKRVRRQSKDAAEALIYFTNPAKLKQLKMLALYWHFVDLLWIYLLFFFLFNHL